MDIQDLIDLTKQKVDNGENIKDVCKYVFTTYPNTIKKYYITVIIKIYPQLIKGLDTKYFKDEKRKIAYIYDYITDNLNKCKTCGKLIPSSKQFCCTWCVSNNKEIRAKVDSTCLNISKNNGKKFSINESKRSKRKVSLKDKTDKNKRISIDDKIDYSKTVVKDVLGFSSFGEKVNNIIIEKYGVDKKSIKNKTKKTNIERYGCECYFQSQECKKSIKNKYGVDIWARSLTKNMDNFNKEYWLNNFIKNGLFDIKKCMEYHDIGRGSINKWKIKFGINYPNSLAGISEKENDLFNSINDNTKYQSDRVILGDKKELDIVIPRIKLAIEYDGSYWHSLDVLDYNNKDGINYHLNKTLQCKEKGYQLFHVFEYDDIEIWKSMINNKLGLCEKIYARKCEIREVDYNTSIAFLEHNHLQGACPSKYRYGLYYNDELVELITFGKSRFNKKYDYELLRLCTKLNTTVVGGASKLFKHFVKHHNGSVISYANRRFSNGNVYEQLGFKYVGETQPNYCYVKREIMLTRIQCQKHKLKDILGDNFDPNLTEKQNMLNNGYNIMYDCGNLIYEYI